MKIRTKSSFTVVDLIVIIIIGVLLICYSNLAISAECPPSNTEIVTNLSQAIIDYEVARDQDISEEGRETAIEEFVNDVTKILHKMQAGTSGGKHQETAVSLSHGDDD